jgi:2-polyprenyl-3-methyl-5-hydroxy-6-metoxy-1,4-benzoquinol methylase
MLEPDGERFIPEFMGGQLIEAEHVIRYALAAEVCKGRKVLDAGCGVGWGTELLWGAGAESASGVDLSPDAIENARARVPGADFREGNLADLPFGDDAFDLVVCFEAIEHVEQQEKVFDELVRVLAPGGILMVSSPNPRVYPAGNPFHIHELVPEELVEAARRRLKNVRLLLQHEQMASMLVQGDALEVGRSDEVLLRVVRPLRSGSDPYSVIVASDGELPELPTIVGSAPSVVQEQLAERTQILTQAAERLRTFVEEARYPRRETPVPAEWEREQAALRRDRERLGARLLECEQQLAAAAQAETVPHSPGVDLEVSELRIVIAHLESERADMLASTSWRLTKPVRMLGHFRSRRS